MHNTHPERNYPDLHDHIRALELAGHLRRVDIPINKETELAPLARWQFRGGVPENERKAWLFTNLHDSTGRKYEMPVLIGACASNADIYSIGLGIPRDKIVDAWTRALANPIPPRVVENAPCQEIVIRGSALSDPGQALDGLPSPITTPGWDNAPYFSAIGLITKDPDSGVQNLGCYRAQVKLPTRLGFNPSVQNRPGAYVHWLKYKERGQPMPAAFIIGGPMSVAYAAMWKMPEGCDEVAVAGALVGSPINVVRTRTVDLLVPAESEIVVEGFIDTEYLEPEGPFGESHGHVNAQEFNGVMDVTAITRRKDAVFFTYLSQIYPNEISAVRAMTQEHNFLQHLREHLGIKDVLRVVAHQPLTGNRKVLFIVFARGVPRTEVWRGLYGLMTLQRASGKIIIAVDDDIEPSNLDAVLWSMAFRCDPHLDMKIVQDREPGHAPSEMVRSATNSALLVDATLKHRFPPISLPKREYMERARDIWENELHLPKLNPETPWFGYSLGDWNDQLEQEAARAVNGEFWDNGRLAAQRRRNDVAMNTDTKDVDER